MGKTGHKNGKQFLHSSGGALLAPCPINPPYRQWEPHSQGPWNREKQLHPVPAHARHCLEQACVWTGQVFLMGCNGVKAGCKGAPPQAGGPEVGAMAEGEAGVGVGVSCGLTVVQVPGIC